MERTNITLALPPETIAMLERYADDANAARPDRAATDYAPELWAAGILRVALEQWAAHEERQRERVAGGAR